ncbi:MAG TPA: hypothetical protein VM432_06165, partial [Bdellovibrionales bacterium]|nr:hypothetical protein [Bdellovibrionales bacterium]
MDSSSLATAAQFSRKRTRLAKITAVVKVTVERHQRWRLIAAGVFFVALLISAIKPELGIAPIAVAIFIPLFAWLVVRTARWKAYFETLTRYAAFLERQEQRLRGKPSGKLTPDGLSQDRPESHDLYYFGPHSLWSLLDETITDEGALCLHSWMMAAPPPSIDQLRSRQSDVQGLQRESWFFTRLILSANPSAEFRVSTKQIDSFLRNSFVRPWFLAALIGVYLVWAGFVASIVLSTQGTSSYVALG